MLHKYQNNSNLFWYSAVVLDLDGVITDTRNLHIKAWKETFEEFFINYPLSPRPKPFDPDTDYIYYIDGKTREEGIKSFLASRKIILKEGPPGDKFRNRIVNELSARKNTLFLNLLESEGPHVFIDALEALNIWRTHGIPLAIVSSSRNCLAVLQKTKLETFFSERVDGIIGENLNLRSKPEPDYFLEAARRLQVEPDQILFIEDSIAGIEAGKRGHFGMIIGIDRSAIHFQKLIQYGAHHVISTLKELFLPKGGLAA